MPPPTRKCPWCDERLTVGSTLGLWTKAAIYHMEKHAQEDVARQAKQRQEAR